MKNKEAYAFCEKYLGIKLYPFQKIMLSVFSIGDRWKRWRR